jgi:hypothetical protein
MMLGMGGNNTAFVICLMILVVWSIVSKVLSNQRRVTRTELHGTVTYTIKGYSGPEVHHIVDSLVTPGGTANVVKITKMGERP